MTLVPSPPREIVDRIGREGLTGGRECSSVLMNVTSHHVTSSGVSLAHWVDKQGGVK